MLARIEAFLEANRAIVWTASILSVLMFVGTLAVLPWLVKKAPTDFFVREPPPHRKSFWFVVIARNVLGVALLTMGALMLILPGQGVLTLLAGLCLLDFPGKRRALRRLVTRKSVSRPLQWLRRKVDRPPFDLPDPS